MTDQQILNQINALTIALVNKAQDIDQWMDTRGNIHALVNQFLGDAITHLAQVTEPYPEDIASIDLIRAEYYGPEVEWDLDEILEEHNVEIFNAARTGEKFNKTHYTKEDIKDLWIKWNTLHIEFKDGEVIEEEGHYDWEVDTKDPRELRGFDHQGNRVYGPDY